MRVDLYTLCWNEADVLGFFFRHYDPVVTRYVVFDDGSIDGSLDILRRHPRVEVRRFVRTHPESFVLSQRDLQNEVWKESRGRADWVIVTAVDEHLHAAGWHLPNYLDAARRSAVTAIPAVGFQMLSEAMPDPDGLLCATRTVGAAFDDMNKLSIFNPDAIADTGFTEGRHRAVPTGDVRLPPRDELMLLHYKYIGFERTLARHAEQSGGLGPTDRKNQWGFQYQWDASQLRASWDAFAARAIDVASPGFAAWKAAARTRWWRPAGFQDAPPRLAHRIGLRSRFLRL